MSLPILTAICALGCFLICGIPSGLIIARASSEHVDVRKVGSGNIGMTNVARSAGASAAALTLLCDAGKGAVAILLARLVIAQVAFGGDWSQTLAQAQGGLASATLYASCVLGHIFSPYLHFKGGKGISVGLGAGLGFCWPVALSMLAVFVVLAIPTGFVSLGSIFAALSLVPLALLFGVRGLALVPLAVISLTVVWAHRENVRKLVRGEERRFSIHKKGDKLERGATDADAEKSAAEAAANDGKDA